MVFILVEIVIVLCGFAVVGLLFYHVPKLKRENGQNVEFPTLSVIIPARNEEGNLPLLLADLARQSLRPSEIICVDDGSTDETARIAGSFGIKVISLRDKPEGWTGKTWACQNGADEAKGELLLFLDADVRLGENGILRLMQTYSEDKCTISVQPYHVTKKLYEQCSLFFNLIQIGANGTALPKQKQVGLYGPVILVSQILYVQIGGHRSVRTKIVEDMALGRQMKRAGIRFRLYVGDKDLSFRMYGTGPQSLFQGWVKNISSGAARTPKSVFCMVFFWIASVTSVPVHLVIYAVYDELYLFLLYLFLYVAWVVVLFVLSSKVGYFRPLFVICYPILLFVFLAISFFLGPTLLKKKGNCMSSCF